MEHSPLLRLWKASRATLRDLAFCLCLLGVLTAPALAQGRGGGSDDQVVSVPRAQIALFQGRPEYIAIGPPAQSNAAANALAAAGAQLLRVRPLPGFGLQALVFDFRGQLGLGQAQTILGQAAPATVIDVNALYRYAQAAPRLYAATMIGDTGPGACRIGGVSVGMIDGPVNPAHPALSAARISVHSALLPNDRPPDAAHGTAVAALIAGEDSSGALAGYARGVRLVAVSAFARETGGEAADVDRISGALDILARGNVRLVNMSFAGPVNRSLDRVLQAAGRRGMAMIAAAGNDGSSRTAYPAGAGPVIAVTAVDAAQRKYRSANTGRHIDFAAPGVDLYVATATGAKYASGTSYAAPIVTALAARRMAKGTSAGGLLAALQRQAADIGPPGRDTQFGWGLLRSGGC